MQVRLPWVLSRKRLITAVVLEGTLFVGLYYNLFQWRFDRWPGFSFRLTVLFTIWMLCSYVAGRFTSGDSKLQFGPELSLVKQITSTALVLAVTLVITFLSVWIFNRYSVEVTSRSFLIPFLGIFAVSSSIVQFLLDRFVSRQESTVSQTWFFVGSTFLFDKLQLSIRWSRLPVDLIQITPSELVTSAPKQIVFEQASVHDPEVISDLLGLQENGSTVTNLFDWSELILQRFPSTFLSDLDLLCRRFSKPAGAFQVRLKRVGDVIVSVVLLLLTSPLLLLISILIKLEDHGPIIYSQMRTGFHGQPYKIWKLRTMRVDAELMGVRWSSRADSRVTKIGAMLRRTRLDELPQLLCVLNGTMSLIGPRPERPEIDLELEKMIPFYKLRFNVRPGLSGWAQVNYPYGASFEDSANKLSYDLYYLRNFSFWLDLLILFKTIRLVFNAQGALPDSRSASMSSDDP